METLRKEHWELSERGQLGPRKPISITIRQREQCGYVRFREILVAKRLSQYRAGEGTGFCSCRSNPHNVNEPALLPEPARLPFDRLVGGVGAPERIIGHQGDDGVDLRVHGADAIQMGLNDFA
jgi:hypothetical protein